MDAGGRAASSAIPNTSGTRTGRIGDYGKRPDHSARRPPGADRRVPGTRRVWHATPGGHHRAGEDEGLLDLAGSLKPPQSKRVPIGANCGHAREFA